MKEEEIKINLDEIPEDKTNEQLLKEGVTTQKKIKNDFYKRKDKELKRRGLATDGEFYFIMYFRDSNQKEQYLKQTGLESITHEKFFISGLKAAELQNIDIEQGIKKPPLLFKDNIFSKLGIIDDINIKDDGKEKS